MEKLSVQWNGKKYDCEKYDKSDLPKILEVFFFWKTATLLAKTTESKNPPLPEKFSERFCCLVCGLVHKSGSGPDAFRLDNSSKILSVAEIKATITPTGFTDVKRDLNFDELYWLSFADYAALNFEIYKFTKEQIKRVVDASGTERDRGTVNLKKVASFHKLQPIQKGCIGIQLEKNVRAGV
jgi:hypothetical protein